MSGKAKKNLENIPQTKEEREMVNEFEKVDIIKYILIGKEKDVNNTARTRITLKINGRVRYFFFYMNHFENTLFFMVPSSSFPLSISAASKPSLRKLISGYWVAVQWE